MSPSCLPACLPPLVCLQLEVCSVMSNGHLWFLTLDDVQAVRSSRFDQGALYDHKCFVIRNENQGSVL